jgi:hypothetical protein
MHQMRHEMEWTCASMSGMIIRSQPGKREAFHGERHVYAVLYCTEYVLLLLVCTSNHCTFLVSHPIQTSREKSNDSTPANLLSSNLEVLCDLKSSTCQYPV